MDETALQPGQLTETGLKNLQSLQELITQQVLPGAEPRLASPLESCLHLPRRDFLRDWEIA